MLLGYAHIVVAVGKAVVELHHARAFAHGGGDGHQFGVDCRHVAQPRAKHLAEGLFRRSCWGHQAHLGVEFARTVVGDGVDLSQLIALAFAGDHVQELRSLQMLDVFQCGNQRVEVVTVDGTDVVKAKLFKQSRRHHHAFGLLFKTASQVKQRRRIFQDLLAHFFGGRIKTPTHELRQIAVERTDGRADRHIVVVEDHQQIGVRHPCVVERLKGHARGHGTIANDGHTAALLAFLLGRQSHAQRGRNTGGGMRCAKSIKFAFVALGKACQAIKLSQGMHSVASTGENFVRIGLVTHVPHQTVMGCIEDVMQCHREFYCAEV